MHRMPEAEALPADVRSEIRTRPSAVGRFSEQQLQMDLFIPIGLNSSNAGEYTFMLFVVIAVALVVSWIVAVLFSPCLV